MAHLELRAEEQAERVARGPEPAHHRKLVSSVDKFEARRVRALAEASPFAS